MSDIYSKVSEPIKKSLELKTLTGVPASEVTRRLDDLLPKEAYKEIMGGKGSKLGLTDIVPAYLPHKLNEIFGPLGIGWNFKVSNKNITQEKVVRSSGYEDIEWQASCDVEPWYYLVDKEGHQTVVSLPAMPGASKNSQREWAEKGAVTNALGAAWSFAGWQVSVYMGLRSHENLSTREGEPTSEPANVAPAPIVEKKPLTLKKPNTSGVTLIEGAYKRIKEIMGHDQVYVQGLESRGKSVDEMSFKEKQEFYESLKTYIGMAEEQLKKAGVTKLAEVADGPEKERLVSDLRKLALLI